MLFVKTLLLYLILKIILSWKASLVIAHVITFDPIDSVLIRLIFIPDLIFSKSPELFLGIGIALSIINVFRPNYILSGLLFWYLVNYFRIHYALVNGADIVLVTLFFLSIGLSIYPRWKRWEGLQMLLFNGSSLMIKIQIAIIYLVSGVDKLYSPGWRNGDAIHYMFSLDYLMNPKLTGVIPDVPLLNFIVSWCVISFEILFPFLIWNRKTKLWMLAIGTLFHIAISVMLSLVDFGLIMIISYIIFLKDEELKHLVFWRHSKSTPALS
jgi:hypothetical protein